MSHLSSTIRVLPALGRVVNRQCASWLVSLVPATEKKKNILNVRAVQVDA